MATCSFFLRLFLAVLVLHLHGAEAQRTRCKTTKDCVDPENVQFCDENFPACMPCDSFCTGAADTIPICREKCPIRYTAVYGRDKQPEAPKVDDVPQDDPTPPKEPAPGRQNKKETGGNHSANQTMIVLGCFFAFVVVTVVASVAGWYYLRWKKQTSETGHGDPENPTTDKLMDGEKNKDEDNGEGQPDNNDRKPENNDGKAENDDGKPENDEGKPEDNEMENKDAKTEHGQADVHPTGTDVRVFNHTTDTNFAGLRSPNTSIEIEECKGVKAAQTTPGQPLQSNGSLPHMPKS